MDLVFCQLADLTVRGSLGLCLHTKQMLLHILVPVWWRDRQQVGDGDHKIVLAVVFASTPLIPRVESL